MTRCKSLFFSIVVLSGCSQVAPKADMSQALYVFETLSADDMQGRRTGSEGGLKAQVFLREEIAKLNVFNITEEFAFTFTPWENRPDKEFSGRNFNGLIDIDDEDTGPLLVITAHYDHLGIDEDKIYNGADDNASGSAALFAIARSFAQAPPQHDVLFIWLDAEELALGGAVEYMKSIDNFKGRPVFNLNLDMISQNEHELYMSGSYHMPALKPLLMPAAKGTGLKLSFGHDRPEDKGQDWTLQSDHGVFHKVGIPFAYFGVEDHAYYHHPSDTFDTVPVEFYKKSVQTIINAAHILDKNLEDVARPAKNATK